MPLTFGFQSFDNLDYVKTDARASIVTAMSAFVAKDGIKLANQLLEAWRILQNEYDQNLYAQVDLSFEAVAKENRKRMVLAVLVLHDLALACAQRSDAYRFTVEDNVLKDKVGRCKLDVHALQYGWKGNTTVDELEVGDSDNTWPEGSGVSHVILTKDPLGALLDKADNFYEAALIIVRHCQIRLSCDFHAIKSEWADPGFLMEHLEDMYIHAANRKKAPHRESVWPTYLK
jgi:hypothetical protein